MADRFIGSSFKNRLFYFGLVTIFAITFSYLFWLKDPSIKQSFEDQAFELNYSALKNGIRFAHYQYLLKQGKQQKNNTLAKLHYNKKGYPISAIDMELANQRQTPKNAEDCRNIWKFVLGPLQPKLDLTPSENDYWVELSSENTCLFYSNTSKHQVITYHPQTGLVELTTIND